METDLEEGQIVLCTVDKIVGTTVFVKIEGNGEGTITTSEISPGRIRNLREYVVPGKKIVCKILRINKGIYLSLRRVKQQEKKELLNRISREKSLKAMLKTVLENWEEVVDKITEKQTLLEFFEEVKENPKILDKYISKKDAEKIIKILESKKEKEKEVNQIIHLSSKAENGVKIIKDIIGSSCTEKCDTSYLSAGRYKIGLKGNDFKTLKNKMSIMIENLEKSAKKHHAEFSLEKH